MRNAHPEIVLNNSLNISEKGNSHTIKQGPVPPWYYSLSFFRSGKHKGGVILLLGGSV